MQFIVKSKITYSTYNHSGTGHSQTKDSTDTYKVTLQNTAVVAGRVRPEVIILAVDQTLYNSLTVGNTYTFTLV